MATQEQVIELHRKNPTWTAGRIALELDCLPEYVRKTAWRKDLNLPKAQHPLTRAECLRRAEYWQARAQAMPDDL